MNLFLFGSQVEIVMAKVAQNMSVLRSVNDSVGAATQANEPESVGTSCPFSGV